MREGGEGGGAAVTITCSICPQDGLHQAKAEHWCGDIGDEHAEEGGNQHVGQQHPVWLPPNSAQDGCGH